MEFIDTHTHLYDKAFDDGGCQAVVHAINAGVTRMVLAGTRTDEFEPMERLRNLFPENIFLSYGIHPTEITAESEREIEAIDRKLAAEAPGCVAVGEIGIDLYWEKEHREEQMRCFDLQCRMALRHNLPILIHCRAGLDETLEVLSGLPDMPRGVFHCFSGSEADIERIRRAGDFYFGIGGIVTFKNSTLGTLLPAISLNRILLETDAPYLAPTPLRGTRNESANIPLIAAKVAECLGETVENVACVTTSSAEKLLSLVK